MSPWEDRYVRELVEEFDRQGRLPASAARKARKAVESGAYRDALDITLAASRSR